VDRVRRVVAPGEAARVEGAAPPEPVLGVAHAVGAEAALEVLHPARDGGVYGEGPLPEGGVVDEGHLGVVLLLALVGARAVPEGQERQGDAHREDRDRHDEGGDE